MKKTRTAFLSLLLPVLLAAAAGGARASRDAPALTAEEIVARHLAAAGGREALSKFKSRVAVGTFKKEGDPDAQMAIMSEAPDRLAAVYVFRDYDWRLIHVAGKSTIRPQFPRQVAPIEDKYRQMLASGLMFNGIPLQNLLLAPGPDVKFTARGTKKVKGREAYVVEVKRGKDSPARLFFDAETFMWVRTEFGRAEVTRQMGTFTNDVVNQGASETGVDFYVETADFRDVGGVKLPFRVEMVVTSPILRERSAGTLVGNIKEYRHDVAIEPSMFQ